MKKALFSLFLITSITLQAQIPDYFGNNPTWHIDNWYIDWFGTHTDESCIGITGDSTIGMHTYKIFQGYPDCGSTPDPYIGGLYRQEGRTIYRYWNGIDSLYISYELHVGDSVKANEYSTFKKIDRIDSIIVGSNYRRIFLIDTANWNYHLIEGIGTRSLPHACEGNFFYPHYYDPNEGWAEGNNLYTYSENGIVLYGQDICSALAIEEAQQESFSLYPVPANNYLFVQTSAREMQLVEILDLNGRIILSEQISGTNHSTDVSKLENGVYFIRVQYKDHGSSISKFIKQ